MVLPVSTPDWSSQDGTETEAQGRVRTTETDRSRASPPGSSNKGERTRHQQRTRQRQRQRTRQRQTSLHLQPAHCKRLRILTYRIEASRRSRLGGMARAAPFDHQQQQLPARSGLGGTSIRSLRGSRTISPMKPLAQLQDGQHRYSPWVVWTGKPSVKIQSVTAE